MIFFFRKNTLLYLISILMFLSCWNSETPFDENDSSTTYFNEIIIENVNEEAYRSIKVIDLDKDSDKDIILAEAYNIGGNSLKWFENNGSNSYTEHYIPNSDIIDSDVSGFLGISDIEIIDIDNDTDLDILVVVSESNSAIIYQNNGYFSFKKVIIMEDLASPQDLAIADLDNDGDLDWSIASYQGGDIIWLENMGAEQYIKHIIDSDFQGANNIQIVDIDLDGINDVIATSFYSDFIAWWKNDGSGSFEKIIVQYTPQEASHLSIVDLDLDGDQDALVVSGYNGGGDYVYFFENDGQGSFTQKTLQMEVSQPRYVYAADLDNDSDLDIIIGGGANYSDTLSWFENDSSNNFEKHEIDTTIRSVRYINISDYDSDNDMDIIGTDYSDSSGILSDGLKIWGNNL